RISVRSSVRKCGNWKNACALKQKNSTNPDPRCPSKKRLKTEPDLDLNTTITGRGTAAWSKTKSSRGRDRFTKLRRTEIANRLCQVGRVEQVLSVNSCAL